MYKKSGYSWLKHWDFTIIDFITLQLSLLLAYFIFEEPNVAYRENLYLYVAIIYFSAQVFSYFLLPTFKNVLKRGYYIELSSTIKQVVIVTVMALTMLFMLHLIGDISRLVIGFTSVFYLVSSYVGRIIRKKILFMKGITEGKRSIIIITTNSLIAKDLDNFTNPQFSEMQVRGVVLLDEEYGSEGLSIEGCENITVMGRNENVIELIKSAWVDEAFVHVPQGTEYPATLVDSLSAMGITIHDCILPPYGEEDYEGQQYVDRFGNYTVLTTSVKIVSSTQMMAKRILDIVGGIVGTLITIVLAIIFGPIIYIKSPGPIFFKQTRIGKNGKTFEMFKFRSMYMDAEERKKEYMEQNKMDGLMFKMDDDPRIIGSEKKGKDGKPKGIGNFIRNTSIDEFPQFLNVLKGDMSLVGTRPPTLDEWEQYDVNHRLRMCIKPGITGLWQISGRSKITDFEEVVKLDSRYIRNWSFGEDIKILLKTVVVVLKKDGAE